MDSHILEYLRQLEDQLQATPSRPWHALEEWRSRALPLFRGALPQHLDDFMDHSAEPDWAVLKPSLIENPGWAKLIAQINAEKADNAKGRLLAWLEGLVASEPRNLPTTRRAPISNRIFVVHGHDEEMKQRVARTLEQLGLEPVVLHEQAHRGRTIIEKFIDHSEVGFAVVLLSPDDVAYCRTTGSTDARPRARQNVIFELGYFLGKLGRDRVVTLFVGSSTPADPDGIEMPSDYSGVLFTPFDGHGKWAFELVRELRAAGYAVDANRLVD